MVHFTILHGSLYYTSWFTLLYFMVHFTILHSSLSIFKTITEHLLFIHIVYRSHPNQTYVFCSTRRPHTLYSVEGDLEMHFHSDKSVVGYGFKIAFQLVPFTQTIGQASCRLVSMKCLLCEKGAC